MNELVRKDACCSLDYLGTTDAHPELRTGAQNDANTEIWELASLALLRV